MKESKTEAQKAHHKVPKVYVGMVCDLLHEGHLNIISTAYELVQPYGQVIVGLLTDEAVKSYKRTPIMNWESRFKIVSALSKVSQVIPQTTLDYTNNLKEIKPEYVVHGDDWKHGPQKHARQKVISTLSEWDGKLIEPTYTHGISTTELIERIRNL